MSSLRSEVAVIVRNDLRLQWRDLWGALSKGPVFVMCFGLVAVSGLSVMLAFAHSRDPVLRTETIAWCFFGLFMFGVASQLALKVLFERSDIDLLLSSPVSSRSVLVARMISIAAGALLNTSLLAVPLIAAVSVIISPRYLWGLALLVILSAVSSSAGIWMTLGFVRWLGVRRARVWAQVTGALMGAGVYMVFYLPRYLSPAMETRVRDVISMVVEHSALAFVSLAGRGDWARLLAIAVLAIALVAVTARLLAKLFLSGVQESIAFTPAKRRPGGKFQFVDGIGRATFRKDLRLTARDPLLLASVLPSLFYLFPIILPVKRFVGTDVTAYLALGGFVAMLQLSVRLTEVAAAGEDCWDLIRISPASALRVRLGKIAAGMALPGALCVALAVAVAFMGHPGGALFTIVTAFTAVSATCWATVAEVRPTPRKDIIQRKGGMKRVLNVPSIVSSLFFLLAGSAAVMTAMKGYWIAAVVVYGVMALFAIGCFTLIRIKDLEPQPT